MPESKVLPSGFGGDPIARFYEPKDESAWDGFVATAWNGTLLHTRRYLSYHRDRFQDRSLVVEDAGRVVGLLPAALDPDDPRHAVSHPGLTYGGLVLGGEVRGEAAIRALRACAQALLEHGCDRLTYKSVPTILHRLPSEDDLYALWRLGASLDRTDLWAWVPASRPEALSRVRRRALGRAVAAGIETQRDLSRLPEFWAVLTENLQARHDVAPTHSLSEITTLSQRFREHISLTVALDAHGALLAGALTFRTPGAVHIQYSSPAAAGREVGALDAVYERIIKEAAADGLPTSFGSSTESGGRVLNSSLYHFKATFGATSCAHQFFGLRLSGAVA